MTFHASSLAEENERALLLRYRHGASVASGKAIKRRIGVNQGEFKFGNGAAEHDEVDRPAVRYGEEQLPEERAVSARRVQPAQHGLPDGLIAETAAIGNGHGGSLAIVKRAEFRSDGTGSSGESGYLDQLRRRDVGLRNQQ